jgi:hypothetical protein
MKRLAGLPGTHRFTAARRSNITWLARAATSAAPTPSAAPSAPAPAAALTTLGALASFSRARTIHGHVPVAISSRQGRAVAARVLPNGARTGFDLVAGSLYAWRLLAPVLVAVSMFYALALLISAFALVGPITRTVFAPLTAAIPISAAIPVAIAISALPVAAVAPFAPVSTFTAIAPIASITTVS